MTAADKYYLKAKDNYPHYIDDALEALEYGLSCDDTHAGLLTLQGTIYFYDLKQFEAAKECYELALFHDSTFVETYYCYIRYALELNEYTKAGRLIAAALKVKGIDTSKIHYLQALLFEKQDVYSDAINKLKMAKQQCHTKEAYTFYDGELERILQKNQSSEERKRPINIVLK